MPPAPSRTRVVFLQHPREARLAICSAWLAHRALPNSELHRGVRFGQHHRVAALLAEPGAALLFPGAGSTPVEAAAAAPPRLLFVVDGTWGQAERMVRDTPALAALPRLSLTPSEPSGYGQLRREPAPGHLATIDAVADALGVLEGEPARFAPLRAAFRRAVELQLACSSGERRAPRHRPGWRPSPGPAAS
jgi:DTW domain-containing protein YfiP